MAYGAPQKYALVGKETSWATGGSANKGVGTVTSDVGTPKTAEVINSTGISSRAPVAITRGSEIGGVTLTGDFQNTRLWIFAFGTEVETNSASDYTHTYSIVGSTVETALFDIGNNATVDSTEQFTGMLFQSMELSIELNGVLKQTMEFKGKAPTTGTSAGTASVSTLPVFPQLLMEIKINDVAATQIQSASVTVTSTGEGLTHGLGTAAPVSGNPLELKFEYKATLAFDSKAFNDLFVDATAHNFELTGDNGVAYGSGQRKVYFSLSNCILSANNEISTVGNITVVELAAEGTYSNAYGVDNINGLL